jgi:hypothetical protein
MGYARVFWIREEPIRQYIGTQGRDDALTEEVGRQVLSLSVKDTFRGHGEPGAALSLFDSPSVFFPFRSFHSTDFCILVWTGCRLCPLPEASPTMFDALCEMAGAVGTSHVVLPLSKPEYHLAVGGGKWQNPLEHATDSSLYYIYEDFTRDFERRPEKEWPCKEVGTATLNLMLSNWSRSESIRNHGSALSRSCSFVRSEVAVAVWSLNCLRLVSEIEADELGRMREYLARE